MQPRATIYLRRNGSFGAECDGCLDVGYTIQEDSGRFTIYEDGADEPFIRDVSRDEAERAITRQWRAN